MEFLGRKVSAKGISPAPSRVNDLKSLKPPRDKSQLRSCIGLFNFFRSFVPDYANLIAPLQVLTRKTVMFNWSGVEKKAFDMIIDEISKQTLLHYIDYKKRIILQTDASDRAL
ncbi:transposon Ty3-I Gag-Pol polyprotein, partial [Aduncisulcus paluster]